MRKTTRPKVTGSSLSVIDKPRPRDKKALTLTHSVRCFTKVHPKDRTRVNRQITNIKENQNHLSPVSLSTIGGFCSRGLFPLVSVRINAN